MTPLSIRRAMGRSYTKTKKSEKAGWYITQLFEYNNRLLERIENRANFLLISNSFIAATYFSLLSFLLDQTKFFQESASSGFSVGEYNLIDYVSLISVMIPGALLLVSVLFSVRTILPIILRYDIKLNQAYIAAMKPEDYLLFFRKRTAEELEEDFIDEIHILSQITEIKSKRVNWAAISFVVAVCSIPPVVCLFLVSVFN